MLILNENITYDQYDAFDNIFNESYLSMFEVLNEKTMEFDNFMAKLRANNLKANHDFFLEHGYYLSETGPEIGLPSSPGNIIYSIKNFFKAIWKFVTGIVRKILDFFLNVFSSKRDEMEQQELSKTEECYKKMAMMEEEIKQLRQNQNSQASTAASAVQTAVPTNTTTNVQEQPKPVENTEISQDQLRRFDDKTGRWYSRPTINDTWTPEPVQSQPVSSTGNSREKPFLDQRDFKPLTVSADDLAKGASTKINMQNRDEFAPLTDDEVNYLNNLATRNGTVTRGLVPTNTLVKLLGNSMNFYDNLTKPAKAMFTTFKRMATELKGFDSSKNVEQQLAQFRDQLNKNDKELGEGLGRSSFLDVKNGPQGISGHTTDSNVMITSKYDSGNGLAKKAVGKSIYDNNTSHDDINTNFGKSNTTDSDIKDMVNNYIFNSKNGIDDLRDKKLATTLIDLRKANDWYSLRDRFEELIKNDFIRKRNLTVQRAANFIKALESQFNMLNDDTLIENMIRNCYITQSGNSIEDAVNIQRKYNKNTPDPNKKNRDITYVAADNGYDNAVNSGRINMFKSVVQSIYKKVLVYVKAIHTSFISINKEFSLLKYFFEALLPMQYRREIRAYSLGVDKLDKMYTGSGSTSEITSSDERDTNI